MADQLRIWLEEIGLGQHADVFAANDIDLDLLGELSDDDLKELGLSLGHRRRLLRAISERSAQDLPAAIPAEGAAVTGSDEPVREAERRQLTVLFCDLVGSTELSRQHDPEDLRELIRHYQNAISGAVVRHSGYVANFAGDGIIAYFGWPRAEEDGAAQAVRAGLDAVTAVRGLALQARVGIASGVVVIGDLDAAGRRQAGAVAGETPNLAARLQALAGHNEVVIDGLTRQLVGSAFILDDLGPQEVKGLTNRVPIWQVLGERSVETRFDTRAGVLTHFVGREHEVALLLDRFDRAASGEGQVVLLSGEAGVGKSRIIRQLHDKLSDRAHIRLRFQCSPSHMESALYPIIRHLEYAAGFLPDDTPEARLDKLEALLRRGVEDVSKGASLLAALLSLPAADRYGAVELTAEQRNERTLNTLIDQLLGLAAKEPVLYVLEDAHWLDPTTRELVTRTLGRIGDARVLLVITHRPEFQSDWARHPHVMSLTLNRLSRAEGAEIVRAAGGEVLSEETVTRILRRADGVPLFIEELTRSVVEAVDTAGDSTVPETLQASLLARLDRLGGEAKELAQIAAVIGREFETTLLCAVAGKPSSAIGAILDRLVASQIVLRAGAQDGACTFRHALIQDAAYQSLLLSRRREYHRETARILEARFPQTAEDEPEIIAQHYAAAAAPQLAIPYWLRAGKRALARYAVVEPIAHFERGLKLARELPAGAERSRQILDLLLPLGAALYRTTRREEALAAYKEAAALARECGSAADLTQAALGVEDVEFMLFGAEGEAIVLLEAALAGLAEGESVDQCRVLSRLGRALFGAGATERASKLLHDAVDVARRLGDRRALMDALICEHVTTVGFPWLAQQFPARRRALDEMLAVAVELGDPELIIEVEGRRTPALLEMSDLSGFEASAAHKGEAVRRHELTGAEWSVSSVAAMEAILHGDFTAAERLATQALETSSGIADEVAIGIYGVQMFTIRREQGRLAEVAPLFRRFMDEQPRDAAWRPGLALIASDLGFQDATRKAFDDLATAGFAFPIDAKRNITLCYLTEVCTRLGDADRGEALYELLSPYRDLAVVVPVTTLCCGANARYLGMLAAVLGDWTAAEEHFSAALDMDEKLHAWPWLAHTKHEFALALRARGRPRDRSRAETLLAEAAASAERIGMPALQKLIRALPN
jgi:class 3 adenylate cyclase/tetratricopeptide (TPR) repeat protein